MIIFLEMIAVLALFFIIVMIIDCNRFIIREYTCASDKLHKDGRFILLSDLHNKSFGKNNDKLYNAIVKQKPDGILIAGDMYTSEVNERYLETAEFVSRLSKKYAVYYGNGNHEHKTRIEPEIFGDMYEDYMGRVKSAGTTVLINEDVMLPPYNMNIYGLEMERSFYKKFSNRQMETTYLEKLLGKPDPDSFNLLIAHNPEYFETYAKWGADLTVSGHVHGGLMRLPVLGGVISPKLRIFPRYDGGRFEKDGKIMILSRGLGTHTLPIRIFNPGELIVIHLVRE